MGLYRTSCGTTLSPNTHANTAVQYQPEQAAVGDYGMWTY
jgi:hypothetical protein